MELNSVEINQITDYDEPLSFLDKIITINNSKIEAIANITMGESFFQGHFPDNPVMPGVLTIQAMIQAAEIFCHNHKIYKITLSQLQKARFKKMIEPGDQLKIILEQTKLESSKIEFSGKALINEDIACSTNLNFLLQ